MATKIRIATFNLENLDDKPEQKPSLDERIAIMRPQLIRLDADILCLQEIHGQETPGEPRRLLALNKLLENTKYSEYRQVSTITADGAQVYDERNLVILSRFEISEHNQYRHNHIPAPSYQKVMSIPAEEEANKITWERPILHAKINLPDNLSIHVINLHLKSRIPSNIKGQKINDYTWKTASGWAEGYFISSMKRVGQALETRVLIDHIFDYNEKALVVVCGDFNSTSDNVPVQAIRGDVENTGNSDLAGRVLIPCEQTIPEASRFSLLHQGRGEMLDHLMVSRQLLAYYDHTEIHNEILHDESIAFATDKMYPESDHAPVIAQFDLP
ncbi:MAG: endonuclease/exonuclease/phosphatase family protein [Deltaproteobacteria bacterium]|nr:endonuclease/exonuclease/phosphatase family protein [Deltaproteobacteria bacterium]